MLGGKGLQFIVLGCKILLVQIKKPRPVGAGEDLDKAQSGRSDIDILHEYTISRQYGGKFFCFMNMKIKF